MKHLFFTLLFYALIASVTFFFCGCSDNRSDDPITEGCTKVKIKGIDNGIVYSWAIDSQYVWEIRFNEADLNGLPIIIEDIIEIHIVKYKQDLIQYYYGGVPSITCQKINYCK